MSEDRMDQDGMNGDAGPAEPQPGPNLTKPDASPEPGPDLTEPEPAESRPRPTPTGRARRAAAAGVGAEVRRPAPAPRPAGGSAPKPAAPAESGQAGRSEQADASRPSRRNRRAHATGPGQPGGSRSPLWLALLLGVLVLAGAAALVVAFVLPVKSGSTGERDQALAAAKAEVPVILSYDYKTFDAGLAKSKAALTGRAVTDYTKAMTTSIKPNAVKVKAVVQATTDGAGIESVSPDGKQVTAVVFGEQKVTNSTLSAPRTDIFRVRATLDLVAGKWLVSKFDQI